MILTNSKSEFKETVFGSVNVKCQLLNSTTRQVILSVPAPPLVRSFAIMLSNISSIHLLVCAAFYTSVLRLR